jgi:hypothetical protein
MEGDLWDMVCQSVVGNIVKRSYADHSQPLPCFMEISIHELPVTSVPGIPKLRWNFRDIVKTTTTIRS